MSRIEHLGRVRGQNIPVYFESDDIALQMSPEARLILELLPAMRDGRALTVDTADARLHTNLPRIIATLQSWDSERLSPISVTANSLHTDTSGGSGRTGLFFSGGLDSFYSLVKHQPEITDLIFVHGLDVDIEDEERRAMVSRRLREAASAVNISLIEIRTDLRRLWNKSLGWGLSHGAALAAVAHMLPGFSRIYIASSIHAKDITPWGSHPLLDPLWSSHRLEFVHDGLEATRVDKAALVASSDAAMNHLRVCNYGTNEKYNCGKCRKCIYTMLCFEALGLVSRCRSFPNPPTLALVKKTRSLSYFSLRYTADVIQALERRDASHPLLPLLRRMQARDLWAFAWGRLKAELVAAVKLYWQGLTGRSGQGRESA